jgi:hypothetical protein
MQSPGGTQYIIKAPDGRSFRVHETIAYVWQACDGRKEIADIAVDMVKELELEGDAATMEKDNILQTVNQLKHMGLVVFE